MDYWLNIVTQIGIFAMLAMSLNVMTGLTGMLQLGHVGFFAAGAYAAGLLSIYATVPQLGPLNFVLGAAAAMVAAGLFALLIGLPCLRLRGDYLAIATLAFGEVLRMTLNNVDFPGCPFTGGEAFGGATGIGLAGTAKYSPWWLIWLGVAPLSTADFARTLMTSETCSDAVLISLRENAERSNREAGLSTSCFSVMTSFSSSFRLALSWAWVTWSGTASVRSDTSCFSVMT